MASYREIYKSNLQDVLTVNKVEDLLSFPGSDNDICIVTDENRGGIFIYNNDKNTINDEGVVFNGWVRQYSGTVNVKWFGAKGDGIADDTLAIQKALNYTADKKGTLYISAGTYLISNELYIDSNVELFGDGNNSILKASDTMLPELNILTNKNWYMRIDEYDIGIVIRNIKIEANGFVRVKGKEEKEIDTIGGCGIKLLGVRDSIIDNVSIHEAIMHCIDLAAFSLDNNNPGYGHNSYGHYAHPCKYIKITNCDLTDSVVDDGFTCHYAQQITVDNVNVVRTSAHLNSLRDNQNAFEVDDGSEHISITNCYAYGWNKSFYAVGHYDAAPARHVKFDHCTSEMSKIAFGCWNNPGGGDTDDENYIAGEDRYALSNAKNIIFSNCEAINLTRPSTDTTDDILRPLAILGYSNVMVSNFIVNGINQNDADNDRYVELSLSGQGIKLDKIDIYNIDNTSASDIYYGLFGLRDDQWKPANIEITNVYIDKLTKYKYVINDLSKAVTNVENIVVAYSENLTASLFTEVGSIIRKINIASIQILNDPTIVYKVRHSDGSIKEYNKGTIITEGLYISGNTDGELMNGRYTPVATNEDNCSTTQESVYYTKVGRTVFIYGRMKISVTDDTEFSFKLSLPVEGNITSGGQAGGYFAHTGDSTKTMKGAVIYSDADNDLLVFRAVSENLSDTEYYYTFNVMLYV